MIKRVSLTTIRNDKLERKLKRELGNKCTTRGCTRVRGLEFAHKRKTPLSGKSGRGRSNRLRDVQTHPKSYELKCPNHNPRGRRKRR